MQKDFYFNKKESQVKKSWTSTFSCLKLHNFYLRGNLYLVNLNSRHVKSQLNSQRRIKARKKSVERKLPIRIFDDETRLTSRELLEVTRNKETHEFKNGTLAQLRGFSTHVKKPFNRHKAKRVYASEAQIEAAKYFVKLAAGRFHSLKESEIRDLVPIRKNIIEKVFGKFRNHPEVESIMIYIKNLWVIYDEHLYNFEGMDRKVDYYIDLLIKNTSQEEIEKLLALGKTAHEVYCTMRKRQGANLYRIGILAKRGGPRLEIYIREAIKKLVRLHLNKFGVAHEIKLRGSSVQKPGYLVQPNSNLKREILEYWNKCFQEIKMMEQEKAGIFYDILTGRNDRLRSHILKAKVALDEVGYRELFPMYADQIENQRSKLEKRKDLLEEGSRNLREVFTRGITKSIYNKASDEVYEKIAEHLDDLHLEKLNGETNKWMAQL